MFAAPVRLSGANVQLVLPLDGSLSHKTLDELRTAFPRCRINLTGANDVRGNWDGRRVQQLLSNLVVNAILYGEPETLIRVLLIAHADEVCLSVANIGTPIDPLKLESVFDPLTRALQEKHDQRGLGLGRYIAREIAKAHGGDIEVRSDSAGTVFTVRLPRK